MLIKKNHVAKVCVGVIVQLSGRLVILCPERITWLTLFILSTATLLVTKLIFLFDIKKFKKK